MTGPTELDRQKRRNQRVVLMTFGAVFAMVGLSFASVPLYDLFCRVTGFGGTTQVAAGTTGEVLDRTVRVRFTADADRALPWGFSADTGEIEVRIGEAALAYYSAENLGTAPVAGTAVYNVSPGRAGRYFYKVQCFCFEEQILLPGQRTDFPVYFFLDPAMDDDPALDDVTTVTLSYTFYPTGSDALDQAIETTMDETDAAQPASTALLDASVTR